ncbi:gp16 family protein [Wielerella bovis]|uniref:gp16 family protein n=1 Tax=Wielerella bovis TaxID=2917790 RepID=UPI00201980B7|nr:regulatory protein GemA [Wielerella bovis]MCG7655919.1 regulatory protein GemA [Wielerella bovis]MCG7656883.1 regulatory protein GemA [Wielerella bovis]MCG7658108.1 regulatory protein GemA [Wielerella bovis]MCG7658164.1 regulatory protein GemA [Wielerella bovis]MCG7659106.1 regulatory protein GemA [Wielerella bovis]
MAKTYEEKRQGLIAKIHVAQEQLALDDDNYRAILKRITGKLSCKQMNLLELQKIMEEMERLGFKPTKKSIGRKPLHVTDVAELMNKIAVLLKETDKTWEYANGIAKRMFQKDNVNQLNEQQLRKVLIALNYQNLKVQAAQAKKA